jgi:CubicO group peptidase (beta-lactamase class C family)
LPDCSARSALRPVRRLALAFTIVALPCLAQDAPPKPEPKTAAQRKLDERVPGWLKDFNVTGVATAWIEKGQIAWTSFDGEQVPGGPPAGPATLYNVASLTKPVTAEIALRLASSGRISLDESMAAYWVDPDIKDNPWTKKLTPRMVLAHETGFPNRRYETNNVLTFQHEPGTTFGYSGEGFEYLGHFMERKARVPFEDMATRYLFGRINMKDTSYTPRGWWKDRQAKPVEQEERLRWSAADLLRTTAHDYATFIVSILHKEDITEELAQERLKIPRNLTTEAEESALCKKANMLARCSVQSGFNLGWHVVKVNNDIILDHTGADSDVKTFAFLIPRKQIGAVIFTNGPDVGHQMIDQILAVLYQNPVYAATLWPR